MIFKHSLSSILILCSWVWSSHVYTQNDTTWIEKMKTNIEDAYPAELSTSLEAKYGRRMVTPQDNHPQSILGEMRWQLGIDYFSSWNEIKIVNDLFYDGVIGKVRNDLRELNIDIYPHTWWNLKAGRQALTWGKGDLVFINDLFPKDFRSFFSGRDIQYLKAPSDALKLTINPAWIQLNIIYTPQFDDDRSPTGRRIQFYDLGFEQYRSQDNLFPVDVPDRFFIDDELAWRVQKNIKGYDFAFYGYYGYWKSPFSFDPQRLTYTHNDLTVHGFSIDGSLLGGIIATEAGYYHSVDDSDGTDSFIRNSEWRWLVNYNRDFSSGWSIGLQYYSEIIDQYEAYKDSYNGNPPLAQVQDMLTLQLRKTSHTQRVEWSLFTFYSIANEDFYLRPRIAYKMTDKWKIDLGGNIFGGQNEYTLWNNFNTNNNLYIGLKWAI